MKSLSDEELKKAYDQSKKLGLDPNFIQQLELALKRRQVNIHRDVKRKNNGNEKKEAGTKLSE